MNLLLVDDHTLFREGMKCLLDGLIDPLEVYEAGTLSEATELLEQQTIELILLDLHLPDVQGLDTLKAISEVTKAPIVVMSGDIDSSAIVQAMHYGAVGFIPKASTPMIMHSALTLVLNGGSYIPPEVLAGLPADVTPLKKVNVDKLPLTQRQRSVLDAALTGKTNKSIARDLFISEGTVKAHLSVAYKVLGVNSRAEAIAVLAHSEY